MMAALIVCCRVAHGADVTMLCRGVDWEEVESLQEVAADVDVLYQTRIQKERFQDRPEDYEKARGKYIIDSNIMKILRQDSVIMHPLPRVDEVRLLGTTPDLKCTFYSVTPSAVLHSVRRRAATLSVLYCCQPLVTYSHGSASRLVPCHIL